MTKKRLKERGGGMDRLPGSDGIRGAKISV